MSLTIEQLDNHLQDQPTVVIIGKNLLLKFTPSKSLLSSNNNLQEIIRIPDLLAADNGILTRVDEIRRLSKDITKITEENRITISETQDLYFCDNCETYLGIHKPSLAPQCNFCGTNTQSVNPTYTHIVKAEVESYLNGIWFEDYMEKIFIQGGWKTWCHGEVMGSSGMGHPVDMLAVHEKTKKVAVAECKSGAEGATPNKVLAFAARFFDTKSTDGIFFSLKKPNNPDPRVNEYMDRTPGLHLIEGFAGSTDKQILDQIQKRLGVESN